MASARIRKAKPADAVQLCRLHLRSIRALCASHYAPETLDAWTQGKEPESYVDAMLNHQHMLVAADPLSEQHLMGFASVSLSEACVKAVYVDPENVGQGIGRQLLVRLEEVAEAAGLSQFSLNASLNAVNFYQKMGYVAGKKSPNTLRNGVVIDCVPMQKQIAVALRS